MRSQNHKVCTIITYDKSCITCGVGILLYAHLLHIIMSCVTGGVTAWNENVDNRQ